MIKQAKANNHEVTGVLLDDGNILVFKEEGNEYKKSQNYFTIINNKAYVNINGKFVEAVSLIHTHPGKFSSDPGNPLKISDNDWKIADAYFGGEVRVLMTEYKTLYSSTKNGNNRFNPTVLWQRK